MASRLDSVVRTSMVRLGGAAPHFESKLDLLNCYDTMYWIKSRRNLVGWTYSYDVDYVKHFSRLIVGCKGASHKSIKFASNCHQKCYIDKKEMLISSANLVAPTIQNVSFITRNPILINYMKILFNRQWRYL
jgi:hypothetical protein